MGALTYEPARGPNTERPSAIEMRQLVEEARRALNGRLAADTGADALREIIRVGTSAGGAQAKAVVGWNPKTDSFLVGDCDLPPDYEHWLIKFTPHGLPSAGEEEYEVYKKARTAGIAMSECRLYELDGVKHFMTRRFDRDGNRRHLVQTLCALRHLPSGGPRTLYSYDILFETADTLGLGYEALEEIFRRMAFNVYNREMDDHTKNFSFLMREGTGTGVRPDGLPFFTCRFRMGRLAEPACAFRQREVLAHHGRRSPSGRRTLRHRHRVQGPCAREGSV